MPEYITKYRTPFGDLPIDYNALANLPELGSLSTKDESFVDEKLAELVGAAPETLNTLNELANALGDDPNFATTVTNEISKKVDKTGGSINGDLRVVTGADGGSLTIASTNAEIATPSSHIDLRDGILIESYGPIHLGAEEYGVYVNGDRVVTNNDLENHLPIYRGAETESITIHEGTSNGYVSIAGGTTDTNVIKSVLGEGYQQLINKYGSVANLPDSVIQLILSLTDAEYTVAEFKRMLTVEPAKAEGILSIAYGTSVTAQTAGSITFGYGNVSGAKGYYISSITSNSVTLSIKQNSYQTPTKSVSWAAGDRVQITNDDRFLLTINKVEGNIITFTEDLPFTSLVDLDKLNIPLVGTYDITSPNERSIVNIDKPLSGEVDLGWGSLSMGAFNNSTGSNSFASGYMNSAYGDFGVAFGQENEAGYNSFVSGVGNTASGRSAQAEGEGTQATGNTSHTEGTRTVATGFAAHAEGDTTKALNNTAHAEGYYTEAKGKSAHSEGSNTFANGSCSHAEGQNTIADNAWTHTEGYGNIAGADGSPSVMNLQVSDARASHAEGTGTHAKGAASHTEGISTTAEGKGAHAEGNGTIAKGDYSHASGQNTQAQDAWTHTEGYGNIAGLEGTPTVMHLEVSDARASHAEGTGTQAKGAASHTEGVGTVAEGKGSHAGGLKTIATGDYQTVIGKYNTANSTSLFVVGNGSSDAQRSNAFEVLDTGSIAVGGRQLTPDMIQKLAVLLNHVVIDDNGNIEII